MKRLTAREREVALYIAQGAINKEIAQRMGLSAQTVKNYVSKIMRKTRCRSRVEIGVLYAAEARERCHLAPLVKTLLEGIRKCGGCNEEL